MQVAATASNLFHHLHIKLPGTVQPSSQPRLEAAPSAVAQPSPQPVIEPRLASDVRIADEEIAAGRESDVAAEQPSGAPHGKLRARIADLDRMVRKRLAHFAETRSADDPELRNELRSLSRTFHTTVRDAWQAFRDGETDRASLMQEVRSAYELAVSGFQSASSAQSGNEGARSLAEPVENGPAEEAVPVPEAGSSSPVPGVTVTVTKAAAPAQAPATSTAQPDPIEAFQAALAELAESFQVQVTSLSQLLAEAFGSAQASGSEDAGAQLGFGLKLYAELSFGAGNTLGGQLNIVT